ncbi:VOC family protein [Stakelama sp. CBK3Z-3]|uniref:VOC family protein n=1 Tax=Stakelama flava TaxID=2860338 RepID=A0ABS6XNC5_9SPHN|nr:VOC family protein [Stakelama flava]MBW4331717.1 VOC family protein [Stakelama flava]
MTVLGIGGLFFRARDPDALGTWYRETLGIGAGCSADGAPAGGAGDEWYWMTRGGPVVFAQFAADSDYFAADKAFLLNLRVSDLARMCERLAALGVAIETRAEWDSPETGRFARIHDPEGNPVELWEPPADR